MSKTNSNRKNAHSKNDRWTDSGSGSYTLIVLMILVLMVLIVLILNVGACIPAS